VVLLWFLKRVRQNIDILFVIVHVALIFNAALSNNCDQLGAVKKNNKIGSKLFFFMLIIFKVKENAFFYERNYFC
jgi:hypothetical protein